MKIKKIKQTITSDYFWVVVLSVIVFVICSFRIPSRTGLYLTGDEFAQYSMAAYFLGYDLSEYTSRVGYYSYGFALLIMPLFIIFEDFFSIYKLSLLLNSLLTASIVPLSFALCRRWGLKSLKENYSFIFVILFSALSGAVISYSVLGLAEVALIVTAYANTLTFYKIQEEKCKTRWFIIQAFLLIFGYVLHQRFLGGLIAGLFVIFVMLLLKKINFKNYAIFLGTILLFFVIHTYIKNNVQTNLWLAGGSTLANDYGSVVNKFFNIFTNREVFLSTLRVFAGQLFYLGAASFMVIYFAVHKLLISNIRFIKDIKKGKIFFDYTLMFMLLAFVFTFLISVIFMNMPGRGDHFLYGRYNAIFYSVLCLYVITAIINSEYILKKSLLFISSGFLFLTFLVHKFFITFYSDMYYMNFNTINLTIFRVITGDMFLFSSFILSLFLGVMLVLTQNIDYKIPASRVLLIKKASNSFLLFLCILVSLINAFVFINDVNNSPEAKLSAGINQVMREIKDESVRIYHVSASHRNSLFAIGAYNRTPTLINNYNDIPDGEFYLLINALSITPLFANIDKTLLISDNESGVILYKCIKTSTSNESVLFDMNLYNFSTRTGTFTNNGLTSNGKQGFLMFGPYITIEKGSYIFAINMELPQVVIRDDLGFADVTRNGGISLNTYNVTNSDFIDGKAQIAIPLRTDERIEAFEIRVFTNEGVILAITDVSVFADFSENIGLGLLDFNTQNGEQTSYGLTSSGVAGFLIYGPYTELERGIHIFTIDMELQGATRDDIGNIDIATNFAADILFNSALKTLDFINGKAQITIPFETDVEIENFELRVFVNEGIILTITDVSVEVISKAP